MSRAPSPAGPPEAAPGAPGAAAWPFSPRESVLLAGCLLFLAVVPMSVFLPLYVFFTDGVALLILGAWPPMLVVFSVAHEYFRRSVVSRWSCFVFRFEPVDTVAYNHNRITRVPLFNRWVWTPTLWWTFGAVFLVIIPLVIMLPLGSQSKVNLSFKSSSEVAMWFFSIAPPVMYVATLLVLKRHRRFASRDSTPAFAAAAAAESSNFPSTSALVEPPTPAPVSAAAAAAVQPTNRTSNNDDDNGLFEIQLGSTMFSLWKFLQSHGHFLSQALVAWAVVFMPLACGLSKCIYNQVFDKWPPVTTVPNASVQWCLCFFAIVLPTLYFLALACAWMMPLRSLVYGQVEADMELAGYRVAVDLVARMGWPAGSELQYPYWSMGDILVTTGIKAHKHRGRELSAQRAPVAFAVLVVGPIVALVPVLYTQYLNANPASSWQTAITLFVVITCPIVITGAIATKLMHDALSLAAEAAFAHFVAWTVVCLVLPLAGCIPGLIFSPSPAASSILGGMLVLGPGVYIAELAWLISTYWSHISHWLKRLTLDQRAVSRVLKLNVIVGLPIASLCPLAALGLTLAALLAPTLSAFANTNSVPIVIASLELVAAAAVVITTESAVSLGLTRPSLRATSGLPWTFCVSSVLVGAVMVVQATWQANIDMLQLSLVFQWTTALLVIQCTAGCCIVGMVYKARAEYQRFGYFPDPWELKAPAARFVVPEATHVISMTDEELSRELTKRRLPYVPGDRLQMERILETDIALVREKELEFTRKEEELRVEQRRRYDRSRLAHTVFKEVFAKSIYVRGEEFGSFEVGKIFTSLAKASHSRIFPVLRVTHILEVASSEVRICNIVFGDFRSMAYSDLESIAWVTSESAALLDLPWSALRLLELKPNKKRPRVVVFASVEERDTFLRTLAEALARSGVVFEYRDGKLSRVVPGQHLQEANV